MRHGGGNAGVAARGGDTLLGERRKIIGVNDEMRHPGMLRVLLIQLFQNGGRVQLIGISRVGFGRGGLEGEGVENACLIVVGVALDHLLHRRVVCSKARSRSCRKSRSAGWKRYWY